MTDNNDFLDLGLTADQNDTPEPDTTPSVSADKKPTPKKFIDPEDDKANWPVIMIDQEDDKPNYEFIGVHGTKKNGQPFSHELQVQRGVEVPVPPSVVYTLRNAVETRYKQVKNPVTGKNDMVKSKRSALPWTLISKGKYVK